MIGRDRDTAPDSYVSRIRQWGNPKQRRGSEEALLSDIRVQTRRVKAHTVTVTYQKGTATTCQAAAVIQVLQALSVIYWA